MPEHNIIQEGENKDVRDRFLKETYKAEARRRYFNPFFFSSLVFFSILIAFVVMVMMIILVFLSKAFTSLGSVGSTLH